MWTRLFSEHPRSVGETYGQHWLHAADFAVRMILGGLACLVHACLPFLFCKTASETIGELNERMVLRRRSDGGTAPLAARVRNHSGVRSC
jgi:hypothetical protein